ncbi:DUF4395 domain-containing protein [Microbacterium sp. 179-B 1A2 NHS]|uniref:DUF4395 domain-containing protein n=1 Tax=Microbacterium sp. 179-B 1A2 NHS TaxID=3142383 RepID=UPI0039A06B95
MAEAGLIDPRGPRFAAALTSVLLMAATLLALTGLSTARAAEWWATFTNADGIPTDVAFADGAGFGWFDTQQVDVAFVAGAWALPLLPLSSRVADPGFVALLVVALLFLWGVLSPRTAPWGVLYRAAVQPRLAPPAELEDPRPPRFAQGVGLVVATLGLALHVAGVPLALPIAAALAFVAAFLNAAFGLCLGCRLWLLLQRIGLVGRAA